MELLKKTKGLEIVEKSLQNYSEETQLFVSLCLEEESKRPKFDGLKETDFYQKYTKVKIPKYISKLIEEV